MAAAKRSLRNRANLLRRIIQGAVFFLLTIFLWFMPRLQMGDIFVQFDPLASVLMPLAARNFLPEMLPGLIAVVSAFFFGRIFCGYLCPMGTTIDMAGAALRKAAKPERKNLPVRLHHLKYVLLAFVLGAALLGVNLFFWLAPLPLIARFYGTLVQPFTTLIGNKSVAVGQPVLAMMNAGELEYLQIAVRRFDGIYFVLFFFGVIFLLELVRPRFWCRYLCPAGALLGLCSRAPLWRRRVNKCTQCGTCAKKCPTGAIAPEGEPAAHGECLACRTCVGACPEMGVIFAFRGKKSPAFREELPSRRAFMLAAGSGAGLATLEFLDLRTFTGSGKKGFIYPLSFVRPPGALPESEFLVRCLRCGLCMRICLTNGLQPATSARGTNLGGEFSPVLAARHGPCEPDCNLCGVVCPSGAIRGLTLNEKRWAKIGTSVVTPGRCIAWNNSKSCVVCQEVCPYGAVKIVPREQAAALTTGIAGLQITGGYPVPVVNAEKCFGCGYCEQHCPVEIPAIVSEPLNALRISEGSYEAAGKERGLQLEVVDKSARAPEDLFPMDELPEGTLPPGFTD